MVMLSNDIISSQPRGQMTLEAMGLLADCVGAAYPGILGRGRPVISSSAISSPPVRRYRGPMCCSPLQSIVFDSPRSSVNMLGLVDFFTLTFCKLFPGPVVVVLTNCCWSFFFFFLFTVPALASDWVTDLLVGLFADSMSMVCMLTWQFSCRLWDSFVQWLLLASGQVPIWTFRIFPWCQSDFGCWLIKLDLFLPLFFCLGF